MTHKAQWATQTDLREMRDKGKWFERERKKQWAQGDTASADGRSEEK